MQVILAFTSEQGVLYIMSNTNPTNAYTVAKYDILSALRGNRGGNT